MCFYRVNSIQVHYKSRAVRKNNGRVPNMQFGVDDEDIACAVVTLRKKLHCFEADFFFFDGYTGIVAVNLCVCTSVRKRLERAFGIRSNCICPRMDHIENIVRCVQIIGKTAAILL